MFPSTNTISKCTICQNGNILEASTQLSDDIKDAKIIISTASGLNQKEYTVSADNPIISADISNNPKGVHTVTLIVNGEKADSISIIK